MPNETLEAIAAPEAVAPPLIAICFHCYREREIVLTLMPESHFCQACTTECQSCHKLTPQSFTWRTVDGRVCENCINRYYRECWRCNAHHRLEDSREVLVGRGTWRYACATCFESYGYTCGDCDAAYMDLDGDGRSCPNCAGDLYSYDYRPLLKYYDSERVTTVRDNAPARYHLGFEVEVEGTEYPPREMPQWVFCKSDGSLERGFEVVSHPLSPRWLRSHKGEVAAMLKKLREAGLDVERSCGMHIHVERTAFDGTFHLLKFLEMFYRWGGWALIVSEREGGRLQQWANCGASREDIYRKAKVKANDHGDRYTAVNLENDHTFEVRIFASTVWPLNFFKNMQYVEALVEFTRDASRRKVTPKAFREWVAPQEKRYPELVEWLRKGGHLEAKGRERAAFKLTAFNKGGED